MICKAGSGFRSGPGVHVHFASLSLVDRDDPLCEIVARKIIEIDGAGVREPQEIAKRAVKELGVPT